MFVTSPCAAVVSDPVGGFGGGGCWGVVESGLYRAFAAWQSANSRQLVPAQPVPSLCNRQTLAMRHRSGYSIIGCCVNVTLGGASAFARCGMGIRVCTCCDMKQPHVIDVPSLQTIKQDQSVTAE